MNIKTLLKVLLLAALIGLGFTYGGDVFKINPHQVADRYK